MLYNQNTIHDLMLSAGIVFFEYNNSTHKIEFDHKKAKTIFPNTILNNDILPLKDLYKNIFYKDRFAFKKFLQNIENSSHSHHNFLDVRYHIENSEEIYWLRVQILTHRHKENIYGSIQNITNDKSQLIQTAHSAYTDPLTGMINRERMKKKITLAIGIAQKYKINHGIIAINIDYLSTINAMFGYQTTNDLIQEVAFKIDSLKRKTDILARISSGKFIILLLNTENINIKEKGESILEEIRNTNFLTRSGIISITASGAGCNIPQDSQTCDMTFSILDQCLRISKQRGRDNFCQYAPNIDNKVEHHENIKVSGQIIHAIQDNRVVTAYQPILHYQNESQSFMECLARIKDEKGNFIPAYKFISIAENIGFIKHIDFKLLENAIRDLKKYPHLRLSINLSGHTLHNIAHNPKLLNLLKENQRISSRLCLELTETIPLQDIENLESTLNEMKYYGYQIALDDFGAGYNSFANLKHFNFDIVKIDGSYIKNCAQNQKNQIFIETLTTLANKLNMEVVAEMIDNQEDFDLIKKIGIDYYQGYFLSIPEINFDIVNQVTYPNLSINPDLQKKIN